MPRGGRRPGAGRKPKAQKARAKPAVASPPAPAATGMTDSKTFLESVIRGDIKPTALQMEAARSLLPFQHRKLGETGKKEQRQDDAGKVAGRFAPAAAPLGALARNRGRTH